MARRSQCSTPLEAMIPEAWPTLPELRETFDRPSEILDQARHEIAIGGTIPLGVGADEPFKHDAIHRLCYSGGRLVESNRLEILRAFMNGED